NQIDLIGSLYNWLQYNGQVVDQYAKRKSERKFTYLTNFPLTKENIGLISDFGHLRWKIENEGFDQQKNHGYNITINNAVTFTGEWKTCRANFLIFLNKK
ncbi:MAG: hypothetical protein ACLFT6_08485, partial [Bacteroidales bacterium]